jgi:hypothetical protein
MNGALASDQFAAFCDEIGSDPDIFLIDAMLRRHETLGLIGASDAVVSLHRSEGCRRGAEAGEFLACYIAY